MVTAILLKRIELIDHTECRGCPLLNVDYYRPFCKIENTGVDFFYTNEKSNGVIPHYARLKTCPLMIEGEEAVLEEKVARDCLTCRWNKTGNRACLECVFPVLPNWESA